MNAAIATVVALKPHAPHAPVDEKSAHGQLLSAVYADYHRRLARGEKVDARAYCDQFPPVRSSLAKLLIADEFIGGNPELLLDAPAHWPQIDSTWEGFKLLAELGRGAFARVYLACELALGGRLVAIKCTSFGAREAAMLGRLDHPGVVPIHSIRDLPDQNMTVVCMPYLGHATLDQVCRHVQAQPQPVLRAAAILEACQDTRLRSAAAPAILRRGSYLDGVRWLAARIAGALGYLHAQGICHRDLKPSNILLQPDGTPRLLDFNLSADTFLPKAQVGGTLPYMAPEQLEAMEHGDAAVLTPQVDIFALGVILYEWLAGSHPCAPLPADTDPAALTRHLLRRYQEVGHPPPEPRRLDSSLARIVRQCLRPNPADRPTAVEVELALQRQLRPAQRLARRLCRHPVRIATAAALLLCASLAWCAYHASTAPTNVAEAAFEQGWQAYRAGAYQDAIAFFDKAGDLGAGKAEWHFARARAYQRLGETNPMCFTLAEVEYSKADQARPCGKHSAGRAYCRHRLQSPVAAVEIHYQAALGRGFNAPAVHHNLGCLYKDNNDFQKALGHFEQALALDERSQPTHCQLADLLAAQYLREVAAIKNPTDAEESMPALLERAFKHLKLGSPEMKTAPPNQAVQLARIYALLVPFASERADDSLAWLERAVSAGSPITVCRDPVFRPLAQNPRYLALLQHRPTLRPSATNWIRILDPIDE